MVQVDGSGGIVVDLSEAQVPLRVVDAQQRRACTVGHQNQLVERVPLAEDLDRVGAPIERIDHGLRRELLVRKGRIARVGVGGRAAIRALVAGQSGQRIVAPHPIEDRVAGKVRLGRPNLRGRRLDERRAPHESTTRQTNPVRPVPGRPNGAPRGKGNRGSV